MTLADLDEDGLRALIGHGGDDLVERKRQPPSAPKFGAAVASFANTLGGWVLLGVDDDGTVHGWHVEPPKTDLQSHLANVLRHEVDPLPPFVVDYQEHEGKPIAVMRVFESSDVPHVERGTGAIYVRTAAGKVPVDSHAGVIALAQRGRDAERDARDRLLSSWIVQSELVPPDVDPQHFARESDPGLFTVVVRAAPLTVSPALVEWPISASGGPNACYRAVEDLLPDPRASASIQPRARGVAVHKKASADFGREELAATAIADSLGVVAVQIQRTAHSYMPMHELRREMMRPAINATCDLLETAEALGRTVIDMWFSSRKDVIRAVPAEENPRAMEFHVSSEIAIPTDDEERAALGRRWEREIARELGDDRWENDDEYQGDARTRLSPRVTTGDGFSPCSSADPRSGGTSAPPGTARPSCESGPTQVAGKQPFGVYASPASRGRAGCAAPLLFVGSGDGR
jgi:hypothetical protein